MRACRKTVDPIRNEVTGVTYDGLWKIPRDPAMGASTETLEHTSSDRISTRSNGPMIALEGGKAKRGEDRRRSEKRRREEDGWRKRGKRKRKRNRYLRRH